jgi:hypothetical protein
MWKERGKGIVGAGQTMRFTEGFLGLAPAQVNVIGDGTTSLGVFVYDQTNRLVVCGTGATVRLNFTPGLTGSYRIEVHNLGNVWNRFTLTTR